MPIEFACPGCRKILRVADSAAGKKARCPDCSHVSDVPHSTSKATPQSSFTGFSPPQPVEESEAQWSTGNWAPEPGPGSSGGSTSSGNPLASKDHAENPFSAPASGFDSVRSMSLEEIRAKLAGPAICLMVTGGITAAITTIYMFFMLIGLIAGAAGNNAQDPGELILGGVFGIGFLLIPLIRAGLIIYGAVQMKKMQQYPFAMTAAILSVVPVCSCIVIDLPFGIWALVVLCNAQVKQGFDAAKY